MNTVPLVDMKAEAKVNYIEDDKTSAMDQQVENNESTSQVQIQAQGKRKRMKGKKMRDEFLCPITYELMREPVVACDGHSYERQAIEKWLKTHKISPRSGEPMQSWLLPNHNLRKLIMDIIDEGGDGFYTDDVSNMDRTFEVRPMKVLQLECLGPPESEWNQQSFYVTNIGCIGGRKLPTEDEFQSKESILFKDITVSRRHFEITPRTSPTGAQQFFIRDLGSAGGTFIRIAHGVQKKLLPGMIILLGKHQFTVSSIDDGVPPSDSSIHMSGGNRRSSAVQPAIESLVKNAETIIANLDGSGNGHAPQKQAELSSRLKNLTMELSHHLEDSEEANADAKASQSDRRPSESKVDAKFDRGATLRPGEMESLGSHMDVDDDNGSDAKDLDISDRYSSRRLVLTCCAPDGSPLQGKAFEVTSDGAGLGRKMTNTIPLLMKVADEETGEEKIVNVDTAISSEHAHVDFDRSTGNFFIRDGGVAGKASTNGTWYRLSGPQQESPPHLVEAGTEVLIGTVRFVVKESMTIAEQSVVDAKTPGRSFSQACK